MAKDLTQMPTDKLWKRARAALDEIERRTTGPGLRLRVTDDAADGFRVASSPEATLQRRLSRPHLPKPDPAYLAAFERTRPRDPAPIDTEGPSLTAPGPSEPAE